MKIRFIFFLFLFLTSFITTSAMGYNLGIDLATGNSLIQLKYTECQETSPGNTLCSHPVVPMGSSEIDLSLFFQEPFKSKMFLGFLHYDWGVIYPLRAYSLTNKVGENTISTTTTSSTGETIVVTPENDVDMTLIGIQPTLFIRGGLTIPYFPWILISLGIGPELMYGNIKYNDERIAAYSLEPGAYLEVDIIFLRTKWFTSSLYFKSFPNLWEKDLINLDKDHRIEKFTMINAQLLIGLRLHSSM